MVENSAIDLRPIESLANIFGGVSAGISHIYNMQYTSDVAKATINANEAQTRANALFSDVNQLNLNEKRAGIKTQIDRFQSEINGIKKDVDQLEELNKNVIKLQKIYNDKILEQKREEIIR